jgi:large subunit ribosomal protein L7/L12
LGLKESKEFVEKLPAVIQKGLPKAEAEALKKKITEAGGVVELA